MLRLSGAFAAGIWMSAIAACDLGPVPFPCESDEQCVEENVAGHCEPTGFCSFVEDAAACPSEKRYGEHASEALSGKCVPTCVAAITMGRDHGCLLKPTGEVFCWGNNADGRLGTGQAGDILPPTQVQGIEGVTSVAAGDKHTCAIVGSERTLYCWGENQDLQAGVPGGSIVSAPTPVMSDGAPLTDVVSLAPAEKHTCVLLDGGEVRCFGSNDRGELGTGAVQRSSAEPVEPVLGGVRIELIASGGGSTCVKLADEEDMGFVSCWGDNSCGKLAKDPDVTPFVFVPDRAGPDPGDVPSVIAVGGTHLCYVLQTVYCLGAIADEELCARDPSPLDGEERAPEQLVAGGGHSCLLYETGDVSCWGVGSQGQLGPQPVTHSETNALPAAIENEAESGAAFITQVASGGDTSCALTKAGRVVCWGANDTGQLGGVPTDWPTGEFADVIMDQVICP